MIFRLPGIVYIIVSLFVIPSVWSIFTIFFPIQIKYCPSAYDGMPISERSHSRYYFSEQLLKFLQENTNNIAYLIAVPSANEGADFVIASGRPVLYIGGFLGTDRILTVDVLKTMVDQNRVSYILWKPSTSKAFFKDPYDHTEWLIKQCYPLPYFEGEFAKQTTKQTAKRTGLGLFFKSSI